MVKQFYFEVTTTSKNRYGGRNQKATIFLVKDNKVEKIGETKWNTASYKGDRSEVSDWLSKHKFIDEKYTRNGYYTSSGAEEGDFAIDAL